MNVRAARRVRDSIDTRRAAIVLLAVAVGCGSGGADHGRGGSPGNGATAGGSAGTAGSGGDQGGTGGHAGAGGVAGGASGAAASGSGGDAGRGGGGIAGGSGGIGGGSRGGASGAAAEGGDAGRGGGGNGGAGAAGAAGGGRGGQTGGSGGGSAGRGGSGGGSPDAGAADAGSNCNLASPVSFRRDVEPFLSAKCGGGNGCHVIDSSSTTSAGGYDHAYDWITAGAHSSSCPGAPTPKRFEIVLAVTAAANPASCSRSRIMPPQNESGANLRKPLTACETAALAAWVDEPLVTQKHRVDDTDPEGTPPFPMPPFN